MVLLSVEHAIEEGTRHVASVSEEMARVVDAAGPCTIRPPGRGHFAELCRHILFQQLAGKAASAIHARFVAAVGEATPERILSAGETVLRSAGLSGAKARSLLDLSARVADGRTLLDDIGELADDEVTMRLTEVRGIGPWTADMFLIFTLGRLDIWPVGDFGVRSGYQRVFALPARPAPHELLELGEPFAPYRTIAAWYCWRALELPPL